MPGIEISFPARLLLVSCCGWALLLGLCARQAVAAPPQWKFLFPAGAQRGTTVEVEAHGTFEHWPVQAWVDRPGVTLVAKEEKGKLSATVGADVVPGVYWLRFYDAEGTTPAVPFLVGNLPEVIEQEPNDTPTKPQELGNPQAVVNGRLQSKGDVDTFAVRLEKGQTLIADVEAHRTLRSPVDAVLEIVSSDGFVLARNDDDQELDPRLVFAVPQSGVYLVRLFGFPALPNSTIGLAGEANYAYRLTLTTDGFLDYSLPLAVSSPTQPVEARGWNLPPEAQQIVPSVLPESTRAVLFHPRLANALVVPVVSQPSILADEPSKPDSPQAIELPVTITGRIEKPRDKDSFRFRGKVGEVITFRVESRLLGYPLDPVLEIRDGQGKQLTRVDDAGNSRDAELAFTVPADGDFQLVVSDLHRQGGANFVYRLTATLARPDYALTLGSDTFTVAAREKLEIPITVERLLGFNQPITVRVDGLPSGAAAEPVTSAGDGDTAKSIKLVINAGEAQFAGPIRLIGTTEDTAMAPHLVTATLNGRLERTSDVWLTVVTPDKK